MAAGVGSRISRHLHGQPKCCVKIEGKPLIQTTFELLHKKGLTDIGIVTGYSEQYIIDALKGFTYKKFYNPFFRVTNSIASAWFANGFIDENRELIIMNGDLFLEESILDIIMREEKSPVMFCDSSRIEDADYRFFWQDNLLQKYGKELSNKETTGEYIGIGKLNPGDVGKFKQRVVAHVEAEEDYHCWWEDVIYRLIDEKESVYVKDIAGNFWAEVDYIEDYERILEYVEQHKSNPKVTKP